MSEKKLTPAETHLLIPSEIQCHNQQDHIPSTILSQLLPAVQSRKVTSHLLASMMNMI
jgi:hypothetical protein